jgi:hypothetical protein
VSPHRVFALVSAKTMLWTMIAGSVAVMLIAARRPDPRPAPTPVRAHERPWLSPEATRQLIGPEGGLGPLFADVELGRSAPTPEVRARIAEFARANDVEIHFEVVAGELAAVRFAVTFGGCCGYEGADALGRQLGRTRVYDCRSSSSCPSDWADDWVKTLDDGIHIRGHIHVNRVEVRWERAASLAELLDSAEGALGKTRASVHESAGDRWTEVMQDRYLLEVPYPFDPEYSIPPSLSARTDLGVRVETDRGRVGQVSFVLRGDRNDEELEKTLRARWGRPRVLSNGTLAWRTRDREITATLDYLGARIVIRDPNTGVSPDAGK